MTIPLMTDERQGQLMKAAEATIGLMNIGVDGNAALAKVAADQLMNEQEIDLVAHAVNNSRQLALLQTAKPEDREKAFALVEPQRVKAIKPQPETNQETSTELRYGLDDEPAAQTVAKIDAPDAVGIAAKINPKKANYHTTPKVDHAATLREGWALGNVPKFAEHVTEHVWADEQRFQHKLAQVREHAQVMEDGIYNELDVLNRLFRSADAPKFAQFEQAAHHIEIPAAFINLVYDAADLEALNVKRAESWFEADADVVMPSGVMDALGSLQRIVGFTKAASQALAEVDQLKTKYADEDERSGRSKREGGGGGGGKEIFNLHPELKVAPLDVEPDTLSGAGQSFLGVSEQPSVDAQAFLGSAPVEAGKGQRTGLMDMLPGEGRQAINQTGEQIRLKRLMQDKYVGGHSLPEVVDAYNAALAVNPNFGDAELTSYVRQHLATKGGVPLDMQIRARGQDSDE